MIVMALRVLRTPGNPSRMGAICKTDFHRYCEEFLDGTAAKEVDAKADRSEMIEKVSMILCKDTNAMSVKGFLGQRCGAEVNRDGDEKEPPSQGDKNESVEKDTKIKTP